MLTRSVLESTARSKPSACTENPLPMPRIRPSKAARSENPCWTNLILYEINVDTGTQPWKVKVNKQ
jgi:hypothetical protein